jgi:hypothetical protein
VADFGRLLEDSERLFAGTDLVRGRVCLCLSKVAQSTTLNLAPGGYSVLDNIRVMPSTFPILGLGSVPSLSLPSPAARNPPGNYETRSFRHFLPELAVAVLAIGIYVAQLRDEIDLGY